MGRLAPERREKKTCLRTEPTNSQLHTIQQNTPLRNAYNSLVTLHDVKNNFVFIHIQFSPYKWQHKKQFRGQYKEVARGTPGPFVSKQK